MKTRSKLIVAALAAAFAPISAMATNGYFATGWGVAAQGMAGAGVAVPTDSLSVAQNPALMFFVGNRMDLGIDFFNPSPRGYTANPDAPPPPTPSVPAGTFESKNDWFFLPSFGWNTMLDANSSFGISIGGNGGMNTEYDTATFQNFAAPPNLLVDANGNPIGFGTGSEPNNVNPNGVFSATAPTGVDLAQLMVGFTYARKLAENQSIGITPILAMQRFKATGLEPFRAASVNPDNVTNKGYDYSYGVGFQVGWYGKVLPNLDLGMSYRSPMWMSKFDKYKGLFAEGGDFDIPETFALGLAFRAAPNVLIAFDWQTIHYGDVRAVSNANNIDISQCFGAVNKPEYCLGADNGIGFGWDSMDILKLGVQWDVHPQWTLRGGLSYNTQFADDTQGLFNILAPAVIRIHGAVGGTFRMSQKDEFNFAWTHSFKEELDGTSPSLTGPQTGTLFMEQDLISVSWSHKF